MRYSAIYYLDLLHVSSAVPPASRCVLEACEEWADAEVQQEVATAAGAGPAEKGGSKRASRKRIVREVETLLAPVTVGTLDFEVVETAARHQVLQAAARASETRFNSDTSDSVGAALECSCGQKARARCPPPRSS